MEGTNFNDTHPELLPGEMWLNNYWPEDRNNRENVWVPQGKTIRFGLTAYGFYGQVVPDAKPVFIQKDEHEQRMRDFVAKYDTK